MAVDGTIPITLIASFHRVRALTTDLPLILESIRDSDKIELINDFLVSVSREDVFDRFRYTFIDSFFSDTNRARTYQVANIRQ
jgi:hypothetical protein